MEQTIPWYTPKVQELALPRTQPAERKLIIDTAPPKVNTVNQMHLEVFRPKGRNLYKRQLHTIGRAMR